MSNPIVEKAMSKLSSEYKEVDAKIREVNQFLDNLVKRRVEIEGAFKALNELIVEEASNAKQDTETEQGTDTNKE